MPRAPRCSIWVVSLLGMVGCGSRSEAPLSLDKTPTRPVGAEVCNGLDDDGKNGVDDPFRDPRSGQYNTDAHCGACNQVCAARPDSEREAHCTIESGVARCVATRCAAGHAATRDGHCARIDERLCLACAADDDCGSLRDASCVSVAGESRCVVACALGCPGGYKCDSARSVCVPTGGSCSCDPGDQFDFACSTDDAMREPGAPLCVGRASCNDGVATSCVVGVEICDEQDNDCDGLVDEDFRDELGAYSRDPAHCGQCGSSCLEDTGFDQQLVCGGDPFAPRCALACPDSLDGIAPGDKLDGDLDLTTGCECTVQRLDDRAGPLAAQGELLDENCDGADGIVRQSVYVAGDGDDSWPGSPTRPLRTLAAAMKLASSSLGTAMPRPNVYVASGSYTETLTLVDGVQVHGGYRRDFRALDPNAYLVEVRAPRGTSAPGGAALVGVDVGRSATRLAWLSLRGLDGTASGEALGGYLERPGRNLVLSGVTLRAGVPAEGAPGADGSAGTAAAATANAGDVPRAALEDAMRQCVQAPGNRVQGGAGGRASCGGVDVSGGNGGTAACPFGLQEDGQNGRGPATALGGKGGQDSSGPTFTNSCGGTVCCGLADFSVPTNFEGPRPGANGAEGRAGNAGGGCSDPRGLFMGQLWSGGAGSAGSDGQAGSGGGGGGSGGGALMQFVRGECEFADGLGGGGGGGGAGGCGGRAGQAGRSGAPSVALLVVAAESFTMESVVFATASGGRGGSGGAGGDGGSGGTGASGGSLPMSVRTTPTLAGPFPGARGGSGGAGGAGGGGGGGCGGASVGIWLVGGAPASAASWRLNNRFELGSGGLGGEGGGGAQAGSRGATGEAANVVVQ